MEWRVVLKAKDGEGIAWRDYSMTILRDEFGEYFSWTPKSRKKTYANPETLNRVILWGVPVGIQHLIPGKAQSSLGC